MSEGLRALLTPEELMKRLQISRATMFRLKQKGMPAVKVAPKTLRFDPVEVEAWLQQQGREGS